MDKKSIAGIAVVSVLFVIFMVINGRQQREYQEKLRAYQEYVASQTPAEEPADEVAAAPAEGGAPAIDSLVNEAARRRIAALGETLAASAEREPETLTGANDVMTVDFSTVGGQITCVELKDYTRYAPKGERNERVRMFVPETARFDMSFYIKNGLNNVRVNTSEYVFVPEVATAGDATTVTMTLPVAPGAALRYDYTLYNTGDPARDYLVDFRVTPVDMAPYMASQTSLGIEWSNTSYQNEKGFQNENMYTTLAFRYPGDSSIEELGQSDESKSKSVSTSVNWVGFKQQFFTSALIARDNLSYADMAFTTAQPGSGIMKNYSLKTAVPYTPQTESYDMAFYFGPNKFAILKNIKDAEGESVAMERLVPLGWGIFGWVNRWFVIPVFDLLRNHIASFGIIILILAVLIKLIIFPLTYKSYVSTAKMRVIKPEVDALAAKFPRQEDAMKRQQATMELYKKAGINPMGGCIPMLIQMPIIIAMFRFFPASIELREQSFLWADDLSSYDSIVDLPFSIPFYGDHVSLFALLMAVALFAFSYVNYQQTASSQPQMAGMKFMMVYMMPAMMLLWFNSYSSGLCFYYFLANIITIVQTMVIRRMIDDDKIHAIMQANAAKSKNSKKSKFQLRYEELMRQQEAQQRRKK
ncbi:MAG: membrane protein insertase YidC [Alistipes sp.]|nr:membrane protein insertase YidC [Alistipes sp.]